jgi:glycosyltransferase involved in cell wall biosynthesis
MYPPHWIGGLELTWQSAVHHMRDRGDDVRVLAADRRIDDVEALEEEDPDVHRELEVYVHTRAGPPRLSTRERLAVERHNLATLERHLREFAPDVVNWWPVGGMSVSAIERVRRAGIPAAGVICDDWLVYCKRMDMWARRFGLRGPLVAAAAERLTGVPTRVDLGAAASWLFNSEAMRSRALEARHGLDRTAVAHPGIEQDRFRPAPEDSWQWRLLYVGRIDPRKGIDTAIEALPRLAPDASLTVVGGGDDPHLDELRSLAGRLGVTGRVTFERQPRDEVPSAYANSDAVVFPVRWEEPFGLVPLEAMAVGRPVVATGTGGSAEYLSHEENCLIFEHDDPGALAAAVTRLAEDDALRHRLRERGFETAARFGESSYNGAVAAAVERAAAEAP